MAALAGQLRLDHPDSRIRPHAAADDDFCRALFREERAAQFAPLDLGDGALSAMLDQQFEAQRMATTRRFPDAEAFVIAHAGRDVGRLIVTFRAGSPAASEGTASRPSDSPTLHLIDLALAPAARNCGIGSDVINSLARAGHRREALHAIGAAIQRGGPAALWATGFLDGRRWRLQRDGPASGLSGAAGFAPGGRVRRCRRAEARSCSDGPIR